MTDSKPNFENIHDDLYRFVVENANDYIIVINDKFEIEYINERVFFQGVGYSKNDLIGKLAHIYVHPDDIQKSIHLLKNMFNSGTETGELRYIKKDKDFIWVEVKGKTFKDENDNLKGILIARDIGDRKKYEAEIKASEERLRKDNIVLLNKVNKSGKELRNSEEKYRHLVESSPFSIILVESKGKIVECNLTAEKLLGYSKKELIGKKLSHFSMILQENLTFLFLQFKKKLKIDKEPLLDIQLERKDGSEIWTNVQTSIVKINNKLFLQVMCIDISDRKKAEGLIREEVEKLKELEKIRKDLISNVSHELKTPLMSISGASELLSEVYNDRVDLEVLDLIHIIERGGKRLEDLIARFLDISRLEFSMFNIENQSCNLSEVIEGCSEEMKYILENQKIVLDLILEEDLLLDVDRLRIEQIIMNLLSNAIKNTPPNGNIIISLKKKDNWVEFSVKDSGVGLTPDELVKIRKFSRFTKLDRHGPGTEKINIQGTGLGLFISKNIVEMHNGSIYVKSEGRHKGTTFIIRLPYH